MKWWHVLAAIAVGVIGYETVMVAKQMSDRTQLYNEAEQYARLVGKPFLVVGNPYGMYPCGDITVDIAPSGECPNMVRADLQELSMFSDKQFGSVFASHVLEHIEDIEQGFNELNRVADKAFVAYPDWYSLSAYLAPDHKWLIYSAPPKTEYVEYRKLRGT